MRRPWPATVESIKNCLQVSELSKPASLINITSDDKEAISVLNLRMHPVIKATTNFEFKTAVVSVCMKTSTTL